MLRPVLLIFLGVCFGLPLYWHAEPPWAGLAITGGVSALMLLVAIYVEEPIQHPYLGGVMSAIALASAVAYSLSSQPAPMNLTVSSAAALLLYAALVWGVIVSGARRLSQISQTLEESLPGRLQALDEDLKIGILDVDSRDQKAAFLKKEIRHYRNLLLANELAAWEGLGGLVVFLIFGLASPKILGLNFVSAFFLSTSCGMLASRTYVDPVLD